MILLHTSDWHLGMQFRGTSIAEDQRFFIDEICKIIEREKVDGVLLAGDVFDRSIASADALELYNYAMTRICRNLKTPVMMVAGNHDGADRLSSLNELLAAGGLHIAGRLERECTKICTEDTEIYLLPWLTTERAAYVYPDRWQSGMQLGDAYSLACDDIRASWDPAKKHVLVAHAFVTGAETSVSDRSAEVGSAVAIGAGIFKGFDYVALGHIHGPQDIGENLRYSGTPMMYSFGREEAQIKSVTLIDTADMSRRIVPIGQLHERTTLTGTYEELLAGAYDRAVVNGFVKLEITDSYAGGETFSIMNERYPLLLEIRGIDPENEAGGSSMTLEELEREEQEPEKIFTRYFGENTLGACDEHLLELFREAQRRYESEVSGE